MDKSTLRELIQLLTAGEIEELEVQWSFWHGTRIRLSRRPSASPAPVPEAGRPPSPSPAEAPLPAAPPAEENGLHLISAPMVGTFYRAPSPEAEPFVREGDRVRTGQTLCLIEAMKIMNEIEADVDGEVVEILVGNAEPVEYNQPMIRLRPS